MSFTKVRIFLIKREVKKKKDWPSLNLISFGNYYAKHNFIVGTDFKVLAVVGKKERNRHGTKFKGHAA